MKVVLGQIVMALLLAAAGGACWRASQLEDRLATVQEELALLRYDRPATESADIEQSLGVAGRTPWAAGEFLTPLRTHRATAEYWRGQYDALVPPRDETGAPVTQESSLMLLAANAAFRASQQLDRDRAEQLRALDNAVKQYTNVLKENPTAVDAAYNFEYASRVREAMARSRPTPTSRRPGETTVAARPTMAGDLPEGPTIHGQPGAPPDDADKKQFKVHVPLQPGERPGGQDQGQGKIKVRKG